MVDFEAEKVNNLSISRKYDINFYMISYIKVDVAETELRNFKFSSILEGSSMLKMHSETTDFMYICNFTCSIYTHPFPIRNLGAVVAVTKYSPFGLHSK